LHRAITGHRYDFAFRTSTLELVQNVEPDPAWKIQVKKDNIDALRFS
jgi:hypothetical protein